MSTQKLIVSRETYTKEGKEYFAYFVSGEIKGKPVRVNVVPHDIGGYKECNSNSRKNRSYCWLKKKYHGNTCPVPLFLLKPYHKYQHRKWNKDNNS